MYLARPVSSLVRLFAASRGLMSEKHNCERRSAMHGVRLSRLDPQILMFCAPCRYKDIG